MDGRMDGWMDKRGRTRSTQPREQLPAPRSVPSRRSGCGDFTVAVHRQPCRLPRRSPQPASGFQAGLGRNFSWCRSLLAELVYFQACLCHDPPLTETELQGHKKAFPYYGWKWVSATSVKFLFGSAGKPLVF